MLYCLRTVVAKNMKMTVWVQIAHNTVPEPPGFANNKFKARMFKCGNICGLIIWIGNNQVNIDNRFGRETGNSSRANVFDDSCTPAKSLLDLLSKELKLPKPGITPLHNFNSQRRASTGNARRLPFGKRGLIKLGCHWGLA